MMESPEYLTCAPTKIDRSILKLSSQFWNWSVNFTTDQSIRVRLGLGVSEKQYEKRLFSTFFGNIFSIFFDNI